MLRKNVASQGTYLYAVDTGASPVAGKAGDASNITGAWSKDGGAETAGFTTSHPTEIGGGVYWQPYSQAETNGNRFSRRWASSTSGVVVDPLFEESTADLFPATGTQAGAVCDEVNTGATHNVTNSLGKQVRSISGNTDVIYSSTLPSQSGVTSTQVKLDSGASAVDNAYQFNGFSATGASTGQGSRVCLSYVGATRLATLDSAWTVAPIAGDTIEVTPTIKTLVADRTGFSLVATGLDLITASDPGGVASTFPQMVVQVWRKFFKKSAKAVSGLTIKTYADDGTTVRTTQTYTDDGAGNQTQNSAT